MAVLLSNPELSGLLNNIPLEGLTKVSVGRVPAENAIVVPIDSVSRKHADIFIDDEGEIWLSDAGSLNGLFVNGAKVDDHNLRFGDKISFGQPDSFHFIYAESAAPQGNVVRYEFDLTDTVGVGRDVKNSIVLSTEPTASGRHAKITVKKGICWIQDISSTNGTWVNGVKVKKSRVNIDDTVFIGSSLLRLALREQKLQIEVTKWKTSIKLECIKLGKTVAANNKILDDISLTIKPGEFVGILGPSGAGKSTLLKALNGFSPPTEGAVFLNEIGLFKSYDLCKQVMGYVPQDDVIHQSMTVRKTLEYVARLRLASDQSIDEIDRIVTRTINTLRLNHVAESIVSSLSGGQRKRVSVGAELLTEPALLFLDEPTSGLDPSTEERLMYSLREMSRLGTTILITTHILYNLDLLDKVIILSKGKLIFYGKPEEVIDYFSEKEAAVQTPTKVFDLLEGALSEESDVVKPESYTNEIATDYQRRYKQSGLYKKHVIDPMSEFSVKLHYETNESAGDDDSVSALFNPSAKNKKKLGTILPTFRELWLLTKRNFSLKLSSPKRILFYLAIPILLGLIISATSSPGFPSKSELNEKRNDLIATISSDPSGKLDAVIKQLFSDGRDLNMSGAQLVYQMKYETVANLPVSLSTILMFTMTAIFCGTLLACLEISTERAIFKRERMAGMKSINYLLSKLPFLFVVASFQMVILLMVCSVNASLSELNLIAILVALITICCVSVCWGLFASCLDPSEGQYSVVIAIAFVLPQIMLSGALGPEYFVGMDSMIQSFANLFPARWGMELILYTSYFNIDSVNWISTFVGEEMGLYFDDLVKIRVMLVLSLQALFCLILSHTILERR